MKKTYETPKIEKMVFNYSDVVVASKDPCQDLVLKTNQHVEGGCEEDRVDWTPGMVIGT